MRHTTFKATTTAAITFIAVMLITSVGHAANVHFKNGDPVFTENKDSVSVTGSLAGIGNKDLYITLTAKVVIETKCRNKGGNIVQGKPFNTTVSDEQRISATEAKNGNVSFSLTAKLGGYKLPKNTCDKGNWTAEVDKASFTSAYITVKQGGKVVLRYDGKLA